MKSFKRFAYKIGSIEDKNNPPTVDDNSAEYTNGVFTFDSSHFTNNFSDPNGDSYKFLRLETIPRVGVIKYEDNPITTKLTFNLENISNLTYELPNNYMISSNGYCVFNDSIENIISENETEGYKLSYLGQGRLEFQKELTFEVPNDTDIYAFINVSRTELEQGKQIKSALEEWLTEYKSINTSFTGNLYIIPTTSERWVLYPSMVRHGVFNSITSSGGWDDILNIPNNYIVGNVGSGTRNENWQFNPNTILLSLTNSASNVYHDDMLLQGFSGSITQPSISYQADLKSFLRDYNNFNFFRGVSYPIVEDTIEETSAMVLHTMAAIEGKKLSKTEIESTGTNVNVSFLEIMNPYENLTPLKELGWVGVYDKTLPLSEVFDSGFSNEFTSYIEGVSTTEVKTKTVRGICEDGGAICFNFKVSDDNTENILFSNIATFCFTGTDDNIQEANAPTVNNTRRDYEPSMDIFSIEDFTNNFQDIDGDSYQTIQLQSRMLSSKGTVLDGLLYGANIPTIPQELPHTDADQVSFSLNGKNTVLGNRLLQYTEPLVSLIHEKETSGFSLLDRKDTEFIFYKINTLDSESPIIETIKGKDIGNSTISLSFRISDDSSYNLYSNIAKVYLDLENENTPPTVGDSSDVMTSSIFTFSENHFTTDFTDDENDNPLYVSITENIEGNIGNLTFKGYNLSAPFSFNISEVDELKYVVSDRFVFQGEEVYSFDKSVSEYITDYEALGFTLESNEEGILTFSKSEEENIEYRYVVGYNVTMKEYCLQFKISDDNGIPLFSNLATFCLTIPDTEEPIEFNQPPTVGDNEFTI